MHIILIYLGIFAGIFLEGEMIMISSVIAAHHGYLDLWMVIAIGIVATYISDCLYFFLGQKRGREWLQEKEMLKKKVEVLNKKLDRYPILIFISYRFLYGFRTVAPMAIGVSGTKTSVFMLFSALSTILWAVVYTSAGYLFGEVIKSQLGHIEDIEKYIISGLVLIGIILVLVKRRKKTLPHGSGKML